MRVRYTGDCYRVVLARGGVYEVLAVEEGPGEGTTAYARPTSRMTDSFPQII